MQGQPNYYGQSSPSYTQQSNGQPSAVPSTVASAPPESRFNANGFKRFKKIVTVRGFVHDTSKK